MGATGQYAIEIDRVGTEYAHAYVSGVTDTSHGGRVLHPCMQDERKSWDVDIPGTSTRLHARTLQGIARRLGKHYRVKGSARIEDERTGSTAVIDVR